MILLLNVHLNHFPKHEKYGLCQSIRQAAYDVYALLAECQKRYHNKTSLTKLDVRHEQLRMLINLSFELGYYDFHNHKRDRGCTEAQRRYTAISVLVNELGAMIGGWIRSLKPANWAEA
ncbi:four helix bundle protein [Immundisolibacter sp.]